MILGNEVKATEATETGQKPGAKCSYPLRKMFVEILDHSFLNALRKLIELHFVYIHTFLILV